MDLILLEVVEHPVIGTGVDGPAHEIKDRDVYFLVAFPAPFAELAYVHLRGHRNGAFEFSNEPIICLFAVINRHVDDAVVRVAHLRLASCYYAIKSQPKRNKSRF
jgi:hypothetical protein